MLNRDLNKVPSVSTPFQKETLTSRYQFVDSLQVIHTLQSFGLAIRDARQLGKGSSARHVVKMIDTKTPIVDGAFFEVILSNSHNGTSCLSLSAGVFRLVCSNGLAVATNDVIEPVKLRHTGSIELAVGEALVMLNDQRGIVASEITLLENTNLSEEAQMIFAEQSLKAKYPGMDVVSFGDMKNILQSRRNEDRGNTAWQVFNAAQENLVRGGIRLMNSRKAMGELKNPVRDLDLNKKMWQFAVAAAKAA